MRILMISASYPLPVDNGAKRRIMAATYHMAKSHDVTLLSLEDKQALMVPAEPVNWKDYIVRVKIRKRMNAAFRALFSTRPYGQVRCWFPDFAARLAEILSRSDFDCLWVHHSNMVQYLDVCMRGNLFKRKHRPLIVFDPQNLDEYYFRSFIANSASPALRMYARLEVAKARHSQAKWFPNCDVILCVSQEEFSQTQCYATNPDKVWLVPNGVEIDYFQPVSSEQLKAREPLIVFGASFDTVMNRDGLSWFCREIWPLIRGRLPQAQFWVIGRNVPEEYKKRDTENGIKIIGTVPDIRDYYRKAAVFVVPLRMGGGTKLKTLEAMATGLPIVSTRVGAQGLDVVSGQHLCLADNPDDFSAMVLDLFANREKAAGMGLEARHLVEKKYGWGSIISELDRKLSRLWQDSQQSNGSHSSASI